MKSILRSILVSASLFLCAEIHGNDVTVTFGVDAIDQFSVSGGPTLEITTAVAGSQPTDATDNTTTYSVTTNGTGRSITGVLDTAMPTGLTLKLAATAPTGGTSAGTVTLDDTVKNLVTGIGNVAQSGIALNYTLSATVNAAIQSSVTRTLTLTFVTP